ncbi:PA14 domain-containing protein [Saccharicrinis sp. FJH62]|uniref:PA14 domain-containing protein n=1 Tax=Saccharicrinis sp. FJH62 TaxID=3344657 RepID=UPI0035D49955
MVKKILLFIFSLFALVVNVRDISAITGSPYKTTAVPDTLYLTSENMTESERFAIQTLQGNLAKEKPMILRDIQGHKEIVQQYDIVIDDTYYTNFTGLLTKFANRIDGYILCNSKDVSSNVAVSLAGILNGVAIPTDIEYKAKAAGLAMLVDARGHDERWALVNYKDMFSKTIATYQAPDNRWTYVGDYSVYNNALQFWHEDVHSSLCNYVYSSMDSGATFMGWGPDEYKTIKALSETSHVMHPSDFAANLSTLSNIPCQLTKQKDQVKPFKSVENVHTVCFVMSDGDNVQWLLGSHNSTTTWRNPNQARLSLGWTISPALAELAPIVYNKYVENMQSTEQGRNLLISGPSGRGYFFPGLYPDIENEVKLTNAFMKKADLGVVNIIDEFYTPELLPLYLEQPHIDAMFYYLHSNYSGLHGSISWYKDKPCIGGRYTLHGEGWNDRDRDPLAMAEELNKLSKDIHSEDGYSLIPVHIWTMNVDGVLEVIKNLGPNVRVVDPEEFVWLMKKNIKGLPMGNGNGLEGEYFSGTGFSDLRLTRTDSKIDFNWHEKSPVEGDDNDTFSVRWSGKVQSLYSEEYTFYVNAAGGVKLTVNNQVLFDSLDVVVDSVQTGKIMMEAGLKYDIVLEYSSTTDGANCDLEWESDSHVRQVIPRCQLYSAVKAMVGETVSAFTRCDMNGFSAALDLGHYTVSDLNAIGIEEDSIKVVEMTEGFKVILYEDDNFEGDSRVFSTMNNCLDTMLMSDGTTPWSNQVSSLKVCADGVPDLEGIYYLQNAHSRLYMDVVGGVGGKGDGVNIQQYSLTKKANQMFWFKHLQNGLYNIIPMHSLKSLDVENFSIENDANIQQISDYNSPNQQFIVVVTEIGNYKFIARHSGKIVDIKGSSRSSEANVVQYENGAQESGQWKMIPADVQFGTGDGLKGDYYNGKNFESYQLTRVDPMVNFNWVNISPDSKINADNFSVRWTGKIQPVLSGVHTFYINSDNGRRLWVNNRLIIDKWINDYDVEYSGAIGLIGGVKYDIKLEYFEESGGANCKLEWSSDQIRTIVPQSQLYADISTSTATQLNKVTVYPVPAKNKIFIDGIPHDATLTVYNTMGVLIKEVTGYSIDVNCLTKGIYILNVSLNDRQIITKFIKE